MIYTLTGHDGCTGVCASDPAERTPANSRDKLGMMFMLDTGPSLYVANGILPSIKPTTGGEEMSFNYIPMVELEIAREDRSLDGKQYMHKLRGGTVGSTKSIGFTPFRFVMVS